MSASAAQRIARLEAKIDRLTELVERQAQAPPEPAQPDTDDLISVSEAARLAGVSTQSVRNWIERHGIGRFFDPVYLVDRRLLRDHLIRHRGKLPPELSRG